MKKATIIAAVTLLCLVIMQVVASATSDVSDEYIVTAQGEEYLLSKSENGVPTLVSRGGLSEILRAVGSGSRIVFDGISTADSFEFPAGSFTVCGSLYVPGNAVVTVPQGTSLTLLNFTARFDADSRGYMRIKGGSVIIRDSYIYGGNGGAIVLDYNADTSVTLESVAVSSVSERPAVEVRSGNMYIVGGRIENTAGIAVMNDAGLYLSGTPEINGVGYDIATEKPISLSVNGTPYSSGAELNIRYLTEFKEGSMTEALYSASEAAIARINMYDKDGKGYDLTYFESCVHSDERNFAAVYLPFSVKYYRFGRLEATEQRLLGETCSEPDLYECYGYDFSGWYTDETRSERYAFGAPITESISLYAGYNLLAPEFSVSSLETVYTGSEQVVSPVTLTHPLDGSGGFYTYEWYKGTSLVSTERCLRLTDVSDSGNYSLKISFHYSSDTVCVTAENILVNIKKAEVVPPEISPAVYTGASLSPVILRSPYYTFEEVSAVNAGSYPVVLTLTSPENYCWQDNSSAEHTVYFVIERAENRWVETPVVPDVYEGLSHSVCALALFGSVKCLYSQEIDGEYTDNIPESVGKYYVKLLVLESQNYTALESPPLCFEIIPDSVSSITVITPPTHTDYSAFERLIAAGLTVKAFYSSGRTELIGPDKLIISYQNGDSFRFGDNAVVLSYGGASVAASVSVSQARYDISGIGIADATLSYNGKYQTIPFSEREIRGLDGSVLRMRLTGGGEGIGEYPVSLSFATDSTNYAVPQTIYATLTITPAIVDIVWGNTVFTYDGGYKAPVAEYTDVLGVIRRPEVLGAAVNASGGYTATAVCANTNYIFNNSSISFEIKKADYDFSGVIWSESDFIYDGEQKQVRVSGLPDGVSVVGYTDGSATLAGKYTATASLVWDTKNYNAPDVLSHSWTIYPGEYDMTGADFSSAEYVYDGLTHYPLFVGKMPIGADGIELGYSYSTGATHVSDGRVAVEVRFYTESKNYITPDSITLYVTVRPRGINVNWQVGEYVYDGAMHAPSATATECGVTVSGGAVNAGEYTATATADNNDYYVINSDIEFVISKASNDWTVIPGISDIFESGSLAPVGEALCGRVVFSYFEDAECTVSISEPNVCGIYYMIATVEEGGNYLSLSSSPIAFEIVEVLAIDMEAELLHDGLCAFDRLRASDFICHLINNDGSRVTLDGSAVTVLYENADSLRCADSCVYFSYSGFTARLDITVQPAEYDMSGVVWTGTEAVYDGEEKCPVLSGLPCGITVMEYVGGAKNAGKYTVRAVIDYDEENYIAPVIPECELVISKCRIDIPTIEGTVYNGKEQSPVLPSKLYEAVCRGTYKNAGDYQIRLRMIDSDNYCFGGTETDECVTVFRILPIAISVEISEYDLYLWEEVGSCEYVIASGKALEGESFELLQYSDGERIYLESTNPNYRVLSEGGKINRRLQPSPEKIKLIFMLVLILLVLILCTVAVILNKDRLLNYAVALSDRRKHINDTGSDASLPAIPEKTEPGENNTAPLTPESKEADGEPAEHIIAEMKEDSISIGVNMERADELITDSLAKDLVKKSRELIYTSGNGRSIINVDTLSRNFSSGERVDVNMLKKMSLVPYDTAYIKVLARGVIDKPLSVYANDFSLAAVKMIALTGGEAIKVTTVKEKGEREKK